MASCKRYGGILALILISSLFLPNIFSETYGAKSSIVELRCKAHLSNYIKLGEISYKERYKHNRVVNDCIKLFKNPKYAPYFETSSSVIIENKSMPFKLLYDNQIGEKYNIVKYQICNYEKNSQQKILFLSNSESSIIRLPKSVNSGQCTTFWTELISTNVASIKLSWAMDDIKHNKIRKIF
jgi:hypothetical protein